MNIGLRIGAGLLSVFFLHAAVSIIVHHLPIPIQPPAGEGLGPVILYAAYSRAWIPEAISAFFLMGLLFLFLRRWVVTPMRQSAETGRYYRSLLYNVTDEVIVLDTAGRITDMNREEIAFSAVTRETAIGRLPAEVFDGGTSPFGGGKIEERVADVLRTRRAQHFRQHIPTTSGPRLWKDLRIVPLAGDNGEATHAILTIRDVTREGRLEDQLRRAQKWEAIGTLACGIAHDFNNLLMTILLNIEYVLARCPDGSDEQESMEMALEAGRRASELVDQILTFSRSDHAAKKPLVLAPLVKETLKMLRASLPAYIEIRQRIEAPSERVMADPGGIQQLLIQLCTHAASAMSGGGALTVSLMPDQPGPESPPDLSGREYLRLTVADTGAGIPAAIQDRIFDPFFTPTPAPDTGRPPVMARGTVNGMEGAILVRSESENGSRFDILLPCRSPERDPGPRPPAVSGTAPVSGRILVVDDDDTVVQILSKTLTEIGYEVTGETSGAAALERIKVSPDRYGLIITDLTMPEMSGIDLIRGIQALRPDLPVVMTTGYGEVLSPVEARRLGIRDLMSKPVSGDRLLAVTQQILQKEN